MVFDVSEWEQGVWRVKPPEAGDNMVILQNCFVSRLNLGCFYVPDKKLLFTAWYISNVQETVFLQLHVVSQNTQSSISSF